MSEWDKIFRTGRHTSSNGITREWTVEDLDRLVNNFEKGAPILIRHPQDQDKAFEFGKIVDLKRAGEFLVAQYAEVPEILKMAVKQGLNLAKSISVDPVKMAIRHIGLLGSDQAPAIDGLGPASFSSADGTTDGETCQTYMFSQTQRKETTVDPKDQKIQELEDKIKTLEAGKETEKLQADLDHAKDDLKKEADAHAATKAEFESYKQERADQALAARVDHLADTGRIHPAEKDKTLAYAKAMDGENPVMEFSAADGKTENISPRENFLRDLEARDEDHHKLLSEFAKPGNAGKAGSGNGNAGEDDLKDINQYA
jgi:hypothetical protein